MILKEFKYFPKILKIKIPLQTSSYSLNERHVIFIEIKDDHDNTGFGELSPLPEFGSETIEDAIEELKSVKKRIIGQKSPMIKNQ